MKALALLALLLALPLSACSNDCRTKCQKERSCLGLTDSTGLDTCTKNCELLMEEQKSADRVAACVNCYDNKACELLFPVDPKVAGVCDNACLR